MTEKPLPPLFARRDGFDLIPELGRLRAEEPVSQVEHHWGVPGWLVTRYSDVRAILSDHQRFPSVMPPYFAGGGAQGSGAGGANGSGDANGLFIVYNPPEHTRIRRMLTPEFTMRRLARLEKWIDSTVAEHLDAIAAAGPPAELVGSFALRLPFLVICELFGVPDEDRADLLTKSTVWANMSLPVEQRLAASEALTAYMVEFVQAQRVNPGEGMVGTLARDHGTELTDQELAGITNIMMVAGYETTAAMLSLGTLLLLRNPEYVPLLLDGGQGLDRLIEELLRYLSVTHNAFPRVAKEDVTIAGQQIRAGDLLLCSPPIANRDEELGDGMEQFDPVRESAQHLAFGHGIHHCIGAPLARLEMRIAYPALFRRFPALRMAVPFEEIQWRGNTNIYGLEALPLTW
jgi:cytochrome P450